MANRRVMGISLTGGHFLYLQSGSEMNIRAEEQGTINQHFLDLRPATYGTDPTTSQGRGGLYRTTVGLGKKNWRTTSPWPDVAPNLSDQDDRRDDREPEGHWKADRQHPTRRAGQKPVESPAN